MRKFILVLGVVCVLLLAGCAGGKTDDIDTGTTSVTDETLANMENFLHDGETYSSELFVGMADTYEGTLDGERRQNYVFDLRSKENYDKGHIVGAINVKFDPKDAESFIERIPDDWSVYIIGDNDAEAKMMRDCLKEIDEHLFVYIIEGGYDELSKADGIEKYITTVPGDFTDFTRTEAEKKFDEIVNNKAE